jgi:hypothetical protein
MTSTWFPALHAPPHPADRRHAERGPGFWDAKNEDRAIYRPVKPIHVHERSQACGRWVAVGASCSSCMTLRQRGRELMLSGGLTHERSCILG